MGHAPLRIFTRSALCPSPLFRRGWRAGSGAEAGWATERRRHAPVGRCAHVQCNQRVTHTRARGVASWSMRVAWCGERGVSVACRAACALRWPAVIGWCRWPVLVDGGVLVRLRHAILVELGRTKYRPYRPARRLNVGMGGYWTTRVHDAKLEMRLPMALRASFDVACAAAGVSCSAQVRELMIAWLRSRPLPVDPPD